MDSIKRAQVRGAQAPGSPFNPLLFSLLTCWLQESFLQGKGYSLLLFARSCWRKPDRGPGYLTNSPLLPSALRFRTYQIAKALSGIGNWCRNDSYLSRCNCRYWCSCCQGMTRRNKTLSNQCSNQCEYFKGWRRRRSLAATCSRKRERPLEDPHSRTVCRSAAGSSGRAWGSKGGGTPPLPFQKFSSGSLPELWYQFSTRH